MSLLFHLSASVPDQSGHASAIVRNIIMRGAFELVSTFPDAVLPSIA